MKGIILAGGQGNRLWPLTLSMSKQLLPIYDKPLIYYPLTTLMLAGISEITIICKHENITDYHSLLNDGKQWGLSIRYVIQEKPEGIAQAFSLVADDYHTEDVALILGDNLFYGTGLGTALSDIRNVNGALIFGQRVNNPQDYGIAETDQNGKITRLTEKPLSPSGNLAIPGLYFFDKSVFQKSKNISKSPRGEYEIVDVLNRYLLENTLQIRILERGVAWLDTGTPKNLLDAGNFVRVIEERQNVKIGAPEEAAFRAGFITKDEFASLIAGIPNMEYQKYLKTILSEI